MLVGAVNLDAKIPIISNPFWSFSLSSKKAILWSHATNALSPEKLFFFSSEIIFRGYSNFHCFLGDLLNLVLLAEARSFVPTSWCAARHAHTGAPTAHADARPHSDADARQCTRTCATSQNKKLQRAHWFTVPTHTHATNAKSKEE